jgi:hypothetical protein
MKRDGKGRVCFNSDVTRGEKLTGRMQGQTTTIELLRQGMSDRMPFDM